MNLLWYFIFSIFTNSKVYYFEVSSRCKKLVLSDKYHKLDNAYFINNYEISLIDSFKFVNSDNFENSNEYIQVRHILEDVAPYISNNIIDTNVKRIFHHIIYKRKWKENLIGSICKLYSFNKVILIDILFPGNQLPFENCVLNPYVFSFIRNTYRILLKIIYVVGTIVAFLYKIIFKYRLQLNINKISVDVLLIAHSYEPIDIIINIYKELANSGYKVGLLKTVNKISSYYKSLIENPFIIENGNNLFCSIKQFKYIAIHFAKYILKAIKIKDPIYLKSLFSYLLRTVNYFIILENINSKCIISNEDYSDLNARYIIAKKHNISLINVLTNNITPLYNPYISYCVIDVECCFSDYYKNILIKSGCIINRYYNINNFKYYLLNKIKDNINNNEMVMKGICKKYGINNDYKIITYFSTGNKKNLSYIDIPINIKTIILEYLKEYVESHKNVYLLVKLHPQENDKELYYEEYKYIINNDKIAIIGNSISSYYLLNISNVNITDISSIGIHSSYLGINTVIVNPFRMILDYGHISEKRNSIYVNNKGDLYKSIENMKNRRIGLQEYQYQGCLGNHFYEEIISIIKREIRIVDIKREPKTQNVYYE